MKKILQKFLVASLAVGVINFSPIIFYENNFQIVSVAHAEIQNVTASDSAMFDFGEDDEKIVETVKNVAKMRATQAAKEKAGIFLKSFSKTVNGILTEDDISVYTSNNIEVLNVTYKKIPYEAHDVTGKSMGKIGFAYEATVTAKIDTSGLSEYVERDEAEKNNLIEQNKISQKNISEINQEFDNLRNSSESEEQIKVKLASVYDRMSANEKINEGNKFLDQKNYQAAISKFTDALKLNPMSSTAYYNRGLCYQTLQDYSKAVEDYTEAITYAGSNLGAYNNRGITYYILKEYDKAISDFTKIIDMKPTYKRAYGNRGIVYARIKKDYQKALADLNKAIQMGSTDGEAYYCRGLCHKTLGNISQAEKDFAKAKKLGWNE